jgi:hypothetical protein
MKESLFKGMKCIGTKGRGGIDHRECLYLPVLMAMRVADAAEQRNFSVSSILKMML